MIEDYCSYEVSKLLKEKGFDEKTLSYYEDNVLCHGDWFEWNRSPLGHIAAPTLQLAMKWLREKHKLLISVDATPIYGKMKDDKGRNTCGILYWNYIASGEWTNEKYNPIQKAFALSGETYEEAVEAACIYALNNLI